MKKISLVLLAMGAFLASCSKHNDAPVVPPGEEWRYDINLPVPIEFNTPSPSTRAKAEMIDGEVLSDKDIGLVGVQPNRVKKVGTDWVPWTDKEGNPGGGWSVDQTETVIIPHTKITTGTDGSIDTKKYYPMTSENYYSFYAYSPYDASASLTNSGLVATFDVGYKDIVWAKAVAPHFNENYPGYSAKYLRKVYKDYSENAENYLPKLEFQHLLTAVRFYAISAETDADGTVKPVENVSVASVTIKDVWTKAELVVVDDKITNISYVQGESKAGQLTGNTKGDLVLEPSSPVLPTVEGAEMGALLLVPDEAGTPAVDDLTSLAVTVTLVSPGGDTHETAVALTRSQTGFKAGNRYNFMIKVYDTKRVEITATVIPWNDIPKDSADNPGITLPE